MANYAARSNGVLVGAHTILEMDENRSSGNKIFLKNVGEEAGVQQFTGEILRYLIERSIFQTFL